MHVIYLADHYMAEIFVKGEIVVPTASFLQLVQIQMYGYQSIQ